MGLLRFMIRLSGFCGVLFLAGCATYSAPDSDPVPVEEKPDYTSVTPPPATKTQPQQAPADPNATNAYRQLLDRADGASSRGDYEQALALLERAQRIDPGSGEIYLNLAKTYKAKGDLALARATAERGLLYCRGSRECDALRAYVR